MGKYYFRNELRRDIALLKKYTDESILNLSRKHNIPLEDARTLYEMTK